MISYLEISVLTPRLLVKLKFNKATRHLKASWFSPPSKPPNPDNVMDKHSVGPKSKTTENAMAMGRPTIQEVEHWRATELVEWIQRVLDPPLDPDDAEKIVPAKINGRVFLEGADDRSIFRDAGLSVGASVLLSKLAKGFASPAGKLLSFIPYSKH